MKPEILKQILIECTLHWEISYDVAQEEYKRGLIAITQVKSAKLTYEVTSKSRPGFIVVIEE